MNALPLYACAGNRWCHRYPGNRNVTTRLDTSCISDFDLDNQRKIVWDGYLEASSTACSFFRSDFGGVHPGFAVLPNICCVFRTLLPRVLQCQWFTETQQLWRTGMFPWIYQPRSWVCHRQQFANSMEYQCYILQHQTSVSRPNVGPWSGKPGTICMLLSYEFSDTGETWDTEDRSAWKSISVRAESVFRWCQFWQCWYCGLQCEIKCKFFNILCTSASVWFIQLYIAWHRS